MSVEFDLNNYNQNRQPALRTPFMAPRLVKWGWAKNLSQANVYLIIFAATLIAISVVLLITSQVISPRLKRPTYSDEFGAIQPGSANDTVPSTPINSANDNFLLIEEYITKNLASLSAEKEVLGGKFYITKMDILPGSGIVSYEDGHNAFVADFKYMIDNKNKVTVSSFIIRK